MSLFENNLKSLSKSSLFHVLFYNFPKKASFQYNLLINITLDTFKVSISNLF